MARAELEKIFQPFFTTKKEGSGLGLSAALRIAQKHGDFRRGGWALPIRQTLSAEST